MSALKVQMLWLIVVFCVHCCCQTTTSDETTTHSTDLTSLFYNWTDWMNSTMNSINYTSYVVTSARPVTSTTAEVMYNTSEAYAEYWVKTVISVDMSVDVYTSSFRLMMQQRLAEVYADALQVQTYSARRRRASTVHNATIQMTNVTREVWTTSPQFTDLVYFLAENGANFTTAQRTVQLMSLLNVQDVALTLGYIVIIPAEPYIPEPPPPPNLLWVIAAVIGGLLLLLLVIWICLFIYLKCTRPPRRVTSPRSPHDITTQLPSVKVDDTQKSVVITDMVSVDNCITPDPPTQHTSATQTTHKYLLAVNTSDFDNNNINQSAHTNSGRAARRHKAPVSTDSSADVTETSEQHRKKRKRKRRKTRDISVAVTETELNKSTTELIVDMTQCQPSTSDIEPSVVDHNSHGRLTHVNDQYEESEQTTDTPDTGMIARHTPMYVCSSYNNNRSAGIALWSPYTASDQTAHILATDYLYLDAAVRDDTQNITLTSVDLAEQDQVDGGHDVMSPSSQPSSPLRHRRDVTQSRAQTVQDLQAILHPSNYTSLVFSSRSLTHHMDTIQPDFDSEHN